jgi:hypothetical protein
MLSCKASCNARMWQQERRGHMLSCTDRQAVKADFFYTCIKKQEKSSMQACGMLNMLML